jgi:hypothetical protein
MKRLLLEGRLYLSNNRAERNIKPFVISRKYFLFASTPKSAIFSATIYSIIVTAKVRCLNPTSYPTFL